MISIIALILFSDISTTFGISAYFDFQWSVDVGTARPLAVIEIIGVAHQFHFLSRLGIEVRFTMPLIFI